MVMGRIMAPYGIKGWVKVHTYTEDRATLLDYAAWFIRPRAGSDDATGKWSEFAVVTSREHGATLIAQLKGVDDREAAALLKGADVGVLRSTLPAAAKDEIYYSDLVGLEVVNREGVTLGRVSKVQDFGAHPVLCVQDADGGAERMIPFVPVYVDAVDVVAGRIDVDWQLDY
jgi:16S rRNA processing protein RimM